MDTWTGALPFFAPRELACQCCNTILLDARFAAALPALRLAWGKPLSPTSVCRCPPRNRRAGGHPNSMHLTENMEHGTHGTAAADIHWWRWPAKTKLDFARLARKLGWSVGLHDSFCHVDRRTECAGLPQTIFVYGEWSNPFSLSDVSLSA